MATTFILWPQILFRGNEPEAAPCISTTLINTVIAIIIYKTVAKTRLKKFKILIFLLKKKEVYILKFVVDKFSLIFQSTVAGLSILVDMP